MRRENTDNEEDRGTIRIRDAKLEDNRRIQEIYSPYVADTSISLEINVPDENEIRRRIESTLLEKYPYIVAENYKGKVVGYAYAGKYHEREGYKYTLSISIYLDTDSRSRGIGQKLYDELERRLKEMRIIQIVSIITGKNEKSISFHERNGFKKIGHFPNAAYKLGEWHDVLEFNKTINRLDIVEHPVKDNL